MRTNRNSNKNNKTLLPIACLVLCVLVILLIFLVKKDEIFTNLKQTNFFDRIFGSTPTLIENHEVKPVENEVPLKNDIVIQVEDDFSQAPDVDEPAPSDEKISDIDNNLDDSSVIEENEGKVEVVKEKSDKPAAPKTEKENKSPKYVGKTEVELCFVLIGGDGSVIRKPVKRSVSKNESPLTTAINLLLAGPDMSNKDEAKCMTLIPEGSKLLSARVSDGVAYLNFNDSFEFNPYGIEGSIHQLEQVVYTATTFPTVKSVQFLIEGNKREYLGSEGQWIGSPLSRASF